jgi:hypothetical protein
LRSARRSPRTNSRAAAATSASSGSSTPATVTSLSSGLTPRGRRETRRGRRARRRAPPSRPETWRVATRYGAARPSNRRSRGGHARASMFRHVLPCPHDRGLTAPGCAGFWRMVPQESPRPALASHAIPTLSGSRGDAPADAGGRGHSLL